MFITLRQTSALNNTLLLLIYGIIVGVHIRPALAGSDVGYQNYELPEDDT